MTGAPHDYVIFDINFETAAQLIRYFFNRPPSLHVYDHCLVSSSSLQSQSQMVSTVRKIRVSEDVSGASEPADSDRPPSKRVKTRPSPSSPSLSSYDEDELVEVQPSPKSKIHLIRIRADTEHSSRAQSLTACCIEDTQGEC